MQKFKSERGSSLVEYALLVVLIATIAVGAITVMGGETKNSFDSVASALGGVPGEGPTTTTAPATTTTAAASTTTVTTAAATTTTTTAITTTTHGGGPGPCTGAKKDRPPSCP